MKISPEKAAEKLTHLLNQKHYSLAHITAALGSSLRMPKIMHGDTPLFWEKAFMDNFHRGPDARL